METNTTQATHTAGPWKTNGSQVTANGDWKAPVCVVVSKQDVRPTADAAAKTLEQAHANARLISAAPEMLQILRAMVEFSDSRTPLHPGAVLWDEAREVIAKAIYG